jgi:hypothetical protein
MNFETGNLYICPGFFHFIFPDIDSADQATYAGDFYENDAIIATQSWTRFFGKRIDYCDSSKPILFLAVEKETNHGKIYLVLTDFKKGWIIVEDWQKWKNVVD